MDKENKRVWLTKGCSVEYIIGSNDESEFFLHDGIELCLSVSGGDKFIISDKVYDIKPMDLFIIGSYDIHKETYAKNALYERYYALFSLEFISRFSTPKTDLKRCFADFLKNGSNKIRLSEEQNIQLTRLFNKTLNINAGFGRDLQEQIYLLEIILYASQMCYDNNFADTDYYAKDNSPIIEKLFDYINKNISEELSLDVLAQEVHVSKSYMCKVFKKHTGTTINKYIVARRISEAKRLLKTNDSIAYVCDKTGFNDYAHFIRTFTNKVGISPLQYARIKY